MRFVIAPVAVIVIWAGSAAQAQPLTDADEGRTIASPDPQREAMPVASSKR